MDLGVEPLAAGGKGVVWRFLQFFKENNTFLGIFRLKFLLKNIFLIFLFYLRYA